MIDGKFIINLVLALVLIVKSEGTEQYIPLCLQFMGLDDMNLNGTLIALSEMLAMVITLMQSPDQKRIVLFRKCFLAELSICFVIYVVGIAMNQSLVGKIVSTFLVCVIRVVNSLEYFVIMVYMVEMFETKNRMIGIALSNSGNFLLLPVWLYFQKNLIARQLNPIFGILPFCVLALASTFFLKETSGTELN